MALSIRIFPPLRRLKIYALFCLALIALKVPWALMMCDNGKELLAGSAREDLLARRQYLIDKTALQAAPTQDMPSYLSGQFQGEWAIVTYSMFASALTNIAFMFPETREQSIHIVSRLIDRTLTKELRAFDKDRWREDPIESLAGDNGHIGYLGHLNWMIGSYRFLGGDHRYDDLFNIISASLQRRLKGRPGMCLETYPGEVYFPDNIVVFASIANYSKLNGGLYADLLKTWITHAHRSLLDPKTGLLPFYLDHSCQPSGGARGSGAGWNSFYLPFVDEKFAAEQFSRLKDNLLQTRLVTGIREYPHGKWGLGDVDSGPVILGFSPSGTGFAIGGAAHARDGELLEKLLFTAEIVGSTIEWNGRRNYLVAPLVGEAIILAMKTARSWDLRFVQN